MREGALIHCVTQCSSTGKTLLLNHVASLLGKGSGELVQIQLDESTDSKVSET